MDGKNSSGRRISLLNDSEAVPAHSARLPSIAPSLRSRTSSYTSSPRSPPTPLLVRSDSSDSTAMQTPSPVTPEFGFDALPPAQAMHMVAAEFPHELFPSQKDPGSAYAPPMQQTSGPLPYHPTSGSQPAYIRPHQQQQQQQQQQQTSPSAETGAMAGSTASARSKKNSYPCPMAKQFNCNDYFTTSGHAARHAKKHTGRKDAFCPECNKAFTRKDNMEQHRRTHQNIRYVPKVDAKRAKQTAKRPKPAPIQSTVPIQASLPQLAVDSNLPLSPSHLAPAVQPVDAMAVEYMHGSPYPNPTAYSLAPTYQNPDSSYGLDALAIAASGEKRQYES